MFSPLKHKKPYGGTAVGKKTTFVFPLSPSEGVKRVFLILRKAEHELKVELLKSDAFSMRDIEEFPSAFFDEGDELFAGSVVPDEAGIWHYRFEGVMETGELAFYGRSPSGEAVRGDWLPEWQLTVSECDYKTPVWAKTGVIYHIFADRFNKGEERVFDKIGRIHNKWDESPDVAGEGEDYRADDFFGGNIRGIIEKLGYLKSLGVTCIYLSPIFESASNHRYDTGDYLKIDALFGDETQFKELISKAAEFNIKIMLDGVFNHTGADSLYFNKFGRYDTTGAYQSKASPYYDWYYFNNFPDDYACWWGSTVVPTVNKGAEGYRRLILGKDGVIEKWTKSGVKGWRLDVVDELPAAFTTDLCAAIKRADPKALIVGEVWEDASVKVSYGEWRPYFMGKQLDSVMNYPFKRAILDFASGGSKENFIKDVQSILENYPKESLDCLMNIIGSHDTVRALTVLSGVSGPATRCERAKFGLTPEDYRVAKQRLKTAAALQFTLPGVPCVYYGDEAGMQGFEDPLNRAPYPWGKEDAELIRYYRALGAMRERWGEILKGETHFVDDPELLVYRRIGEKGAITVYANPCDYSVFRAVNGTDAIFDQVVDGMEIPPRGIKTIVSEQP